MFHANAGKLNDMNKLSSAEANCTEFDFYFTSHEIIQFRKNKILQD